MTVATELANHLWQTTMVWLLIWALMPLLRRNSAGVRSRLWFAASLKFLAPFALVSWVAAMVGRWHGVPPAVALVSTTALRVETPFTAATWPSFSAGSGPGLGPGAQGAGSAAYAVMLACVWAIGAAWVAIPWLRQWMHLRGVAREAEPIGCIEEVRLLAVEGGTEPAVFGWFRPVLLLPRGIERRLTPTQMEAVLAHELCHVRRRDNLQFALHTLVTAAFWFHPAVWVIGRHLLRERELACDEAVLAEGGAPDEYAQSILSVCRWYLEAAPECVSGMSGSELKDRVRRILAARPVAGLGRWRKAVLAAIAGGTMLLPAGIGWIDAEAGGQAEHSKPIRFEVVSVRRNPAEMGPETARMDYPGNGDGLTLTDISLSAIVGTFYDHDQESQVGMPDWANHECYDIRARVAESDLPAYHRLSEADRDRMVQAVLEDRFKLRVHLVKKEAAMYALTIAKGGAKLKEAPANEVYTSGPPGPDGKPEGGTVFLTGPGEETGHAATMSMFADSLQPVAGRQVIDKTGLRGAYDFVFRWSAEGADGPSLFTALEEELGLKLEPTRGMRELLVVDHIERPSEN